MRGKISKIIKNITKVIKNNKKKILLIIGISLIIIISVFLYINLTNPTKINSLIASVVNKGEPANNYFDDEVFYRSVIVAYNRENSTSLPYTTNLTDEQLSSIKSVIFNGNFQAASQRIKSTKGVEKLTALTSLNLSYNNLGSIDLSKNTALESLNLPSNNLSSIDINKNTLLTILSLDDNKLNSIDLSKNTALESLNLSSNNLSSIDLSNNTKLTKLYLTNNNLGSIDLSKNTALESLNLSSNNLSSIDLSNNTLLKPSLDLSYNNLSSVVIGDNITSLNLSDNNLSSIDLSNNTKLTKLYLTNNKIGTIDLSKNTLLTTLFLNNNRLSSIDLSKNALLKDLNLNNNELSIIVLNRSPILDVYYILNTQIGYQYSKQMLIDIGNDKKIQPINEYSYYIRNKIVIPKVETIDSFITNLGLSNLIAKIYTGEDENTSGYVKNGDLLKIYDGESVIQILKVSIISNTYFEDDKFYKLVIDAYNAENGTNLPYTTNLTDEQLGTITKVLSKSNDIILSTKGIEKLTSLTTLSLVNNNINSIDLSKNTALTTLNLNKNKLNSIDLSNNTLLTSLDLQSNNLSSIDLSKNTTLTTLNLNKNGLNSIDLSKNTALTTLSLRDNNISSIDLSNDTTLTYLDLYSNNLSSIDLSKNTALTTLNLNKNKLNSIDLSNNTLLNPSLDLSYNNLSSVVIGDNITSLNLNYNNISSIDLSKNTLLTTLFLNNNRLSSIDLSKNTALTSLHLSSNKLSAIDLSKNTALIILDLSDNNLNSIDLSKNAELTTLSLSNNKLSSIDLSKNTLLNPSLDLSYNNLSSVVIGDNITSLNLSDNNLSSIDLSKNPSLISLILRRNKLSNIDLSKNTALTTLSLRDNNISSIDLSKNVSLTYLELYRNNISSIDLSKNTKIDKLYLYENPLKLDEVYIRKGSSTIINNNIKLPEGSDKFYITYDMEDDTIAGFSNNKVTGLKCGSTNLVATLNGVVDLSSKNMEVKGTIKVFDMTSNKYEINKEDKYIYTKTDVDNNTILSNIKLENIEGKIENNQLVLKDGDTVVDTYKIVNISSSKYDLSKEYIYTGTNTFDKNNINVINATMELSNNILNIKYGSTLLQSYKIVSISSSKYDLSKEYIYTGLETFDKNNINVINATMELSNNILNIKYGSTVLQSYKIVSISSSKYDLSKEYIYTGLETFDKNNINATNATIELSNNILNIKYGSTVLRSYKIVSISSSKYDLSKEYIYTGLETFDKNNINTTNATMELSNNILSIKYESTVLRSYKIVSISSSKYDLSKSNIRIKKEEEFDLENINVINGSKEYKDNKLFIKYGSIILKTYTISSRAKGDISGDDNVSISDVSLLYRHVRGAKVITDTETLDVSDLTGDGKITIADVAKLYRYVRGKITEL